MQIILTVLEAAGFVVPALAAGVAFRRYAGIAPPPSGPAVTYDDVERMMKHDLPEILAERIEAVKWPAVAALGGILAATVAGIIQIWMQGS